MPQFLFIDLPNFRIRDAHGHGVSLSYKQLGHVIALYQYVRSGLRSTEYADLCASLVFAAGETDIWTSYTTSSESAAAPSITAATSSSSFSVGSGSGRGGSNTDPGVAGTAATTTSTTIHAEENMLLAYHQSFDSPGAYPIVDALLLSSKPCSSCMGYFTPSSASVKTCKLPGTPSFRAKFTPRSDRTYTPVFYLSSSSSSYPSSSACDPTQTYETWMQLGTMWAADFIAEGRLASSLEVARGQMYYLMPDYASSGSSPWFALNDQETMPDAEVAEAIVRQGVSATYWIGR
ncbi:hypothetical protein PG993_006216 [Apiospora rasikravindrae]|uniref:Uncharacterized protein n=1 Tax=Apiospora rasikravindrae TaxID=990691 RepID=A0ABR1T529_9PEZI